MRAPKVVDVADVLGLVVVDRAALPTAGAAGSLVAVTVRRRADAPPPPAGGSARTATGLPAEASLGQRIRVWRVEDGTWFDPFEAWSVSWGARWSSDGRRLAGFVHRDPTGPQVAVWDSTTREVRAFEVVAAPFFTFERPAWVLGGAALVVETRSAPLAGASDSDAAETPVVCVLRSPDTGVPRQDPLDSSDLTRVGLDGTSAVLVRSWTVRAWRVSPDGGRVGCLRLARVATEEHQAYFDLNVVDVRTGAVVTLARTVPQSYGLGFSWSPDGTQLAYLVVAAHRADELWLVAADGLSAPRRVADGDTDTGADGAWPVRGVDDTDDYQAPRWLDPETVVWHREGLGFVTIALDTGETRVTSTPGSSAEQWLTDIDDPTPPLAVDGSFYSVRNADGGFVVDRITPRQGRRATVVSFPGSASTSLLQVGGWPGGGAFVVHTAREPGQLWLVERDAARRLAELNPGRGRVRNVQRSSWTEGARQVAAGLLLPDGPRPAAGWPLFVNVYGGSRGSALVDDHDPTNGLVHASLLTSRGWAVMFPDLPMSDEGPMHQFAPTLRAALSHLPTGLVDPTRVTVGGNSYGSYTTLSLLVTMPTTFTAAAISAPLANPFASYAALRDDGAALDGLWEKGQGRLGSPPWENPQTWVENSPFLHLDRVRTPLLIGVGTRGLPGEVAQAEQLFGGLRRLGRTTELRRYEGEGHAPDSWSPAAYTDFAQRLLEWIAIPSAT